MNEEDAVTDKGAPRCVKGGYVPPKTPQEPSRGIKKGFAPPKPPKPKK